jgi:predicted amidophosphoribosyltransferase
VASPQVGATLTALLDLVLPVACVGCGRDGVVWCAACTAPLHGSPRRAVPDPCPPGLPVTWAVAGYDGVVRDAVVAHKERGARVLTGALAGALAASAAAAAGCAGPLALVPAPSRTAAVRARGEDPTLRLARAAAVRLRRSGRPARVVPLLRMARSARDQAGLSAGERAVNLAGAVRVGRVPAGLSAYRIVLVDDVVTTGATLAECARSLHAAGLTVRAAAVVAATARRPAGLSRADGRD